MIVDKFIKIKVSTRILNNLLYIGYDVKVGDFYKKKAADTNIKKHICLVERVSHYSKTQEFKTKVKKTCLSNYGFDNVSKVSNIQNSKVKTSYKISEFNNLQYQGSYELDFIKYCESNNIEIERGPSVKYNENKVYHSDFYLRNKNLIVEIKSSWTYEMELDKNLEKQKACLQQGYNFIFIIDKNYEDFEKIIYNL